MEGRRSKQIIRCSGGCCNEMGRASALQTDEGAEAGSGLARGQREHGADFDPAPGAKLGLWELGVGARWRPRETRAWARALPDGCACDRQDSG